MGDRLLIPKLHVKSSQRKLSTTTKPTPFIIWGTERNQGKIVQTTIKFQQFCDGARRTPPIPWDNQRVVHFLTFIYNGADFRRFKSKQRRVFRSKIKIPNPIIEPEWKRVINPNYSFEHVLKRNILRTEIKDSANNIFPNPRST